MYVGTIKVELFVGMKVRDLNQGYKSVSELRSDSKVVVTLVPAAESSNGVDHASLRDP